MSFTACRGRPVRSRALRHGAVASGLVLAVCGVLALLALHTFRTAGVEVNSATERGQGHIVGRVGSTVEVRWAGPDGSRVDTVELAVRPPPVGTRTEVAYDPRLSTVLIPGSRWLAELDRAASGLAVSAVVGGGVVVVGGWQLATRARLRGVTGRTVALRRVRVQAGLLGRSWLETDSTPQRWIPVHFDPVLVTLPAPVMARLHGDPLADRLVGAEVAGRWLPPSGPVRAVEPRGRRTDSPTAPDADARLRAAGVGWWRQLRSDAIMVTPAPLIGLFWVFLDGGGVLTWVVTTGLAAALGLWWAAVRGSDPS